MDAPARQVGARAGISQEAGLLGIAWHLMSALAIVALVTEMRLGSSLWELPTDRKVFVVGLALTHLLGASALWWQARRDGGASVARIAGAFAASYGAFAFALLMAGSYHSRSALAISMLLSFVLASLPVLLSRSMRRLLVPALAIGLVLLAAFSYAGSDLSSRGPPAPGGDHGSVRFLSTMFYNLQLSESTRYARPDVNGGALQALDGGFLLASGDGTLHFLEELSRSDSLVVRSLPYRVPLNREAFEADVPEAESDLFRIGGLLVRELGTRLQLIASHHFWLRDANRFVLRLSVAEAERDSFLSGRAEIEWRTVFDTDPPLQAEPIRRSPNAASGLFWGNMLGGRIATVDARTVLLTVGDHGFDGWNAEAILAQDPNTHYGKTILVDLETGESEIYTMGHRNPQGLHAASDGRIWLMEHGPEGGDELNLLRRGANYGWPFETLGVDYGRGTWPLSTDQGRHAEYEAPVYAWLPSIAPTNLIVVEKDLFPAWRGDLLVASLGAGSLFRVRHEDGRVHFVERIHVGPRIRDLAEAPDGRIVLLFDRFGIGVLEPVQDGAPRDGRLLFAACQGCHHMDDGRAHGIGPNLRGVFGRDIASTPEYRYSSALRRLSGSWTEERLDQFLKDPRGYAPGTTMEFEGIADPTDRLLLISYLRANQ